MKGYVTVPLAVSAGMLIFFILDYFVREVSLFSYKENNKNKIVINKYAREINFIAMNFTFRKKCLVLLLILVTVLDMDLL